MALRSLDELFAYIESFTNLERSGALFSSRSYQLDRMRLLLERFGSPQGGFRCVHIAGSKGKGSTAALLAWALHQAGYLTGLYTSPHVESYLERIAVLPDGPEPELLLAMGERMHQGIEELPEELLQNYGRPTTFELLTLLAFCAFRESACRYAVLETGIGGRLDATNTVLPELCLITPIEREHTDVLGDTLESIAREKGGIIKPGVPVFSSPQEAVVREVLRGIARERASPICFLDEELASLDCSYSVGGTQVRLRPKGEGESRYRLSLIGDYQGENAALVHLAGTRVLSLPERALQEGFEKASLPGRMEIVRHEPAVVLDGAHTPHSVARVLQVFRTLFGEDGVLLFGAAKGKKTDEMAALLAPAFKRIVVTAPGSFKESEPEKVYRQFRSLQPAARLEKRTGVAVQMALELTGGKRPLLVTGSFYLVGEARRAFGVRGQPWGD